MALMKHENRHKGLVESTPAKPTRELPPLLRIGLNLCGPAGLVATLGGWVRPWWGVPPFIIGTAYLIWELSPFVKMKVQGKRKIWIFSVVICAILGSVLCYLLRTKATQSSNDQNLPGLSVNLVLRLQNRLGSQRQYVADFGQLDGTRLSLYVSPDKLMTLAFQDQSGKLYLLTAPIGTIVPLNSFFDVIAEIGIREQGTVMRMFINGREVQHLEIPSKVDFGKFDVHNGVIGANLQGGNGAQFDLVEFAVYGETLCDACIDVTLKRLKQAPAKAARFSGDQWMRIQSFGRNDAHQPDPVLAPKVYELSQDEKENWHIPERPEANHRAT